jgi:hypothetical protein
MSALLKTDIYEVIKLTEEKSMEIACEMKTVLKMDEINLRT